MQFAVNEFGAARDNTYELFFIDEKGHVLNERQILEINDGVNDVKVFGDIVKPAVNNPTSGEVIREKLNKLGNTVYEFNKLDIDNDIKTTFLGFIDKIKPLVGGSKSGGVSEKEEQLRLGLRVQGGAGKAV